MSNETADQALPSLPLVLAGLLIAAATSITVKLVGSSCLKSIECSRQSLSDIINLIKPESHFNVMVNDEKVRFTKADLRLYYISDIINIVPLQVGFFNKKKDASETEVHQFLERRWEWLIQNPTPCVGVMIENGQNRFPFTEDPLAKNSLVFILVCHQAYTPTLDDADYQFDTGWQFNFHANFSLCELKQYLVYRASNRITSGAIMHAARYFDGRERSELYLEKLLPMMKLFNGIYNNIREPANLLNNFEEEFSAACDYAGKFIENNEAEIENAVARRRLNMREKAKSFFGCYIKLRSKSKLVGVYVDYKKPIIENRIKNHGADIIQKYNSFLVHHQEKFGEENKAREKLQTNDILTLSSDQKVSRINALFSPVRRYFKKQSPNRLIPKLDQKQNNLIDAVNELSRLQDEYASLEKMKNTRS